MLRFCAVIVSVLCLFPACASKKQKQNVRQWVPEPIAILPLNNISTDLQGPVLTRYLMHRRLNTSLGGLLDIEEVDEKLKGIGITDGGQLSSVEPAKLGEALKAQGLLYGELQEFKNMNLGVYHKRSVKLRCWLVNAKTGEKLWEGVKKISNSKIAADKRQAAENLIGGYAEKIIEMMAQNPLRDEAETAVHFVAHDLESKFGRTMFPKPVQKKGKENGKSGEWIQKGIQKWRSK